VSGTFRSLSVRNYRTWAAGAIVSNIGTWMQRTAQDWIVLVELTRHNATAVGIVTGLQFGPQLLLLPITGLAADHFDRPCVGRVGQLDLPRRRQVFCHAESRRSGRGAENNFVGSRP